MSHKPPEHVARRLKSYDPALRCRWARHARLWHVERRMPPRSRQYMAEMPPQDSEIPLQRDLYEGWRDGYVVVMRVHPALLGAPEMWETLATADLHRQGGVDRFTALLEAQDQAAEAAVDREIHDLHGDLAGDVHDRIAWLDKRRVALTDERPLAERDGVESRDGFYVVDRRVRA